MIIDQYISLLKIFGYSLVEYDDMVEIRRIKDPSSKISKITSEKLYEFIKKLKNNNIIEPILLLMSSLCKDAKKYDTVKKVLTDDGHLKKFGKIIKSLDVEDGKISNIITGKNEIKNEIKNELISKNNNMSALIDKVQTYITHIRSEFQRQKWNNKTGIVKSEKGELGQTKIMGRMVPQYIFHIYSTNKRGLPEDFYLNPLYLTTEEYEELLKETNKSILFI